MNPKLFLINVVLIFTAIFMISSCGKAPYQDSGVDVESQIDSLISLMTLEEKVNMIHASSSFTSGGVERLGIPELVMSDGPHGVRHEHGRDWEKDKNVRDSSTYLPVGTALAATWNTDLGYQFGAVLGSEANFRGKDIILGPGLNIIRDPLNGRNFEYLTEDPYLNSRMVVGYVKGVQDQGIAACAKHYIANTLEYEREYVNVEMSERALREIYLPGYKAAVEEGGVLTVMAAYNKFRGTYCAHSAYLLDTLLRKEYNFKGLVVSDWKAVKNTMEAVQVGMDIEMGTELNMEGKVDYGKFFLGDAVVDLVKEGVVEESVIDSKVRNILKVMFAINKFGERQPGAYNTKGHQLVARQIADEAIVLLKNDQILPLKKDSLKKLAVIGANAIHKHAGAGGSSQVKAYYEITPFQGLKNFLGDEVAIEFSPAYKIEKEAGPKSELIEAAVKSASEADAVIFVGGLIHGWSDDWNDNVYDAEALDKPDMMLPFGQDKLIRAVLDANPNTIIVLQSGGPVDMRAWKNDAKAIVQAWYAGMEGGNALADILFGKVNPSGKLPMTFPEKLEDSPAHAVAQYPDEKLLIDHKEEIYVGYRYFDSFEVEPAFAFGHGLSYTSFEYKDLSVKKNGDLVNLLMTISNTGEMAGAEVIQVYVKDEASTLERPDKELKAFNKVYLEPGTSKVVKIELKEDAFSYYDDTKKEWVVEPGKFTIQIGSSSRDIRIKKELDW